MRLRLITMSGSNNPAIGTGANDNGDSIGETAAAMQGLGETVPGLDGRQVVAASGHTGSESGAGLDGTVPTSQRGGSTSCWRGCRQS